MEDDYNETPVPAESVIYAQVEPDGIVILNGFSELLHTFRTQQDAEDAGWVFGEWWIDWAGFTMAEATFDAARILLV